VARGLACRPGNPDTLWVHLRPSRLVANDLGYQVPEKP
jgi:hypothetical protein